MAAGRPAVGVPALAGMHQTVDASLNSSTINLALKAKTKFLHKMGMTFTTITGVAEVKIMALSAVISEDKKN